MTGVVIEGKEHIEGRTVVLAAGAMSTPVILQKSGIPAGTGLFVDYFRCAYGIANEGTQLRDQTMAFMVEDASWEHDFMIFPFIDDPLQYVLFCPFFWQLRTGFSRPRTMGLMVKIADERSGTVGPDGKVHKEPTQRDRTRMEAGLKAASGDTRGRRREKPRDDESLEGRPSGRNCGNRGSGRQQPQGPGERQPLRLRRERVPFCPRPPADPDHNSIRQVAREKAIEESVSMYKGTIDES